MCDGDAGKTEELSGTVPQNRRCNACDWHERRMRVINRLLHRGVSEMLVFILIFLFLGGRSYKDGEQIWKE